MRQFKRERGFLTIAQNNATTDYVRLAYGLALSLRATQSIPYLSIAVTPGTVIPDHYRQFFDEVIDLPWGDMAHATEWKLQNEWKAFHVTPYQETIKLDADMLFPEPIDDWWDILAHRDLWFATTVMTYRGETITTDTCRKAFTANRLPNIYTAFMYFKATEPAQEVFELAEHIFRDYPIFAQQFLNETRPKEVSTDVAFALAVKLLDCADMCTSNDGFPAFVHMKSELQGWPPPTNDDWTQMIGGYVTSDLQVKVGKHRQLLPFHYHVKDFLNDAILARYEASISGT